MILQGWLSDVCRHSVDRLGSRCDAPFVRLDGKTLR
jgi:hypothetical protein